MRPRDLIVRGYAQRERDGSYFAICIDLNLYARGDSFDEVREKLSLAVRDYISEALDEDREYFRDLLPRPAPLRFRLRFYLIKLLHTLFGDDDDKRSPHEQPARSSILEQLMPLKAAC